MKKKFDGGVYPVMLTPFKKNGKVDFESLGNLVEWYIDKGVAGLFAVCQSSEMFLLSLEERIDIAQFIVKKVNGRIPVLASGHVSEELSKQAEELKRIADTGVDAVILLTNRLAKEDEDNDIWIENLEKLLKMLPEEIPLGFYECPYPYKRILSPKMLQFCVEKKRFYFIKDTCCDLELMKEKLKILKGSCLRLYNANTSTLLESLEMGAAGFSGVMANFHPDLYVWMCEKYKESPKKARILADFLTTASMIERQVYPVNAKYHHKKNGNFETIYTRDKSLDLLNKTGQLEVDQMDRIADFMRKFIR